MKNLITFFIMLCSITLYSQDTIVKRALRSSTIDNLSVTGVVGINSANKFSRLSVVSTTGTNGNNMFNFVSRFNLNRTTDIQATDSGSFSLSTTLNTGKLLFSIKDMKGLNILNIDSSKNVQIGGYSSALNALNYSFPLLVVSSYNQGTLPLALFISHFPSSSVRGGFITVGTDDGVLMASGDRLGGYHFAGARDNAHNINIGASIYALCSQAWSANKYGADLIFATTNIDANVTTEKMRIENDGDVGIITPGAKLMIQTGSNCSAGQSTLSDGTLTVNTTAVATGDMIFIQRVSGTAAEFGFWTYDITTGTSFTVTSTDAQDDSVFNWWIIKDAP